MLLRKFFPALVLASIISCGDRETPRKTYASGWNENLTLTVDGQSRYFRIYQPVGIPSAAPLVILLHGGGQSMTGIFESTAGGTRVWTQVADDNKFLLVVPNGFEQATGTAIGNNQNWNDCRALTPSNAGFSDLNDVKFISTLIDWTSTEFDIDEKRVYATGVSNGGLLCYRLATEINSKLAAIAPFIANQPDPSECTTPTSPIPIMICVGTLDPLMPFLGGNVAGTNRGSVKSAAETLAYWLRVNGLVANNFITTNLPNSNTADNSTIVKRTYSTGNPAAEIEFYTVVGGGHCMPSIINPLSAAAQTVIGPQNQDAEGARLAWDFLKRHSR